MRRLPAWFLLALALLAAVAVAACGSSTAGAGWTYAPAPSATPVPSGSPSGAPSVGPSASASAAPSASVSPAPSASGGGEVVTVIATSALRFDTPELEAAANTPFTLRFDNRDPTVPHNVVIKDPAGAKVEIGDTSFFVGPKVVDYQMPPLAAGTYPFLCEVHPAAMVGNLTVQ